MADGIVTPDRTEKPYTQGSWSPIVDRVGINGYRYAFRGRRAREPHTVGGGSKPLVRELFGERLNIRE
ncbi:hypothetical protein B0G77_2895 [Paraburkholderia sp. BL10I2N1]|nr:hypothetical protein B0G77_2895 [Paraburkholderia sp. BL10I2N1]